MALYRSTGNLVIRPCDTCLSLVLHEEGEAAVGLIVAEEAQPSRWQPVPHGGASGRACIGNATNERPRRKTVPAAQAARSVRKRRSPQAQPSRSID